MNEYDEAETTTTECLSTDTAEIIVQTFDDGTARIEIAEYAVEVAPRAALDVMAYMTADELRALADHLMAAADLIDDSEYDPADDE